MARPHPALLDLAAGGGVPARADRLLVESAVEHRLGGLMWSRVHEGEVELAPETARGLAMTDLRMQAHHKTLWSAIESMTEALDSIGVGAAVMKGVAVEARWYERMGERPCSDVDLLVEPAALPRVREILTALAPDYRHVDAAERLVAKRRLQHVDLTWEGVGLDLHFDPLKLGIWTRSADLVWANTETIVSPSGREVRMLGPEAALVGFLTHLNKDRFAFLGALVDPARILTRCPELDWDLVHRFVDAEGLQVPVWKSLGVVVETLELDHVDVPAVRGPRAMAWDRLWPPSQRLRGREGRTENPRRQSMIAGLAKGRTPEAIAEWRRQLFPPAELLEVHGRDLSERSYLQRVTVDRFRRARGR